MWRKKIRAYFGPKGSVLDFITFGKDEADKVVVIHLSILQKSEPIES
jgi:hypothetical protein